MRYIIVTSQLGQSVMHYITFPDDDNLLSCVFSSGHFCRLDAALHLVDKIQECSYFLFEDDEEMIITYCQFSILSQT